MVATANFADFTVAPLIMTAVNAGMLTLDATAVVAVTPKHRVEDELMNSAVQNWMFHNICSDLHITQVWNWQVAWHSL